MKPTLRIFCLLFFFQSFSQTVNKTQKLSDILENYFSSDREIIHVQFNKMLYVNNEFIAFKGYVLSKNNAAPNLNTTNVHLVIYNEKQEVIQRQLLFASNGTFNGNLHLTEKFSSGKYYFHFYTNWMNNFKEDDSFMQTIEVIDKNENYSLKSNLPNLATATVKLFPENGIIVDNIINKIGVKLTDCNQIGIAINNGIIVDSKSNEIVQFSTNEMGNGFFYFIPDLNEKYFVKIKTDKINILQELPKVQPTGLLISYNNNLINNVLAINIHTNDQGVEQFQNKKFTLLVHQNKNAIQSEFSFGNKNTDQIIKFDKKLLSNGVNIIRVLDENFNELAEQLVYIDTTVKKNINIEAKTSENDSISLSGKLDSKSAAISLSVLPEKNACVVQKRSILGTFLLNAYLEIPELNNYSYFDPENKSRKQDLELLMLNQEKSKYHWENILAGAPKIKYNFKKGVSIDGVVENNLNTKNKYKITLFSLKDKVYEQTDIASDNKFKFENFYAKDSTAFLFQVSGDKGNTIKSNIFAHVVPLSDRFTGNPYFEKFNCPQLQKSETTFNFKNTKSNITELASVVVVNKFKKDVFVHQKESDNINATGYKIENEFGTVIDFLNTHGFNAILDEDNSVVITTRRNIMKNGGSSDVYIDDFQVFDLNSLYSLNMQDIDEIFLDKSGFTGTAGSDGVIKIYLKPNTNKDFYDPKFSTLIVTSGFAKNEGFKNSEFDKPNEFFTFGTLKWEPNVFMSPNQDFNVKLVKGNQKNIQVLIEGFDADGQLFSEIKNIPVATP